MRESETGAVDVIVNVSVVVHVVDGGCNAWTVHIGAGMTG